MWGESDEVCAGKRNRETWAQSETYNEWGWFNLLSKPWNGIGVIRESKNISVPVCPPLPLSLTLIQSLRKKKKKKATSPASLEQNVLQCCSSFSNQIFHGTNAITSYFFLQHVQCKIMQKSVWNNTQPTARTFHLVKEAQRIGYYVLLYKTNLFQRITNEEQNHGLAFGVTTKLMSSTQHHPGKSMVQVSEWLII